MSKELVVNPLDHEEREITTPLNDIHHRAQRQLRQGPVTEWEDRQKGQRCIKQ